MVAVSAGGADDATWPYTLPPAATAYGESYNALHPVGASKSCESVLAQQRPQLRPRKAVRPSRCRHGAPSAGLEQQAQLGAGWRGAAVHPRSGCSVGRGAQPAACAWLGAVARVDGPRAGH